VLLLSITPRYLKVRALPLMIVAPLLGLVYIVLLPVLGAITIVPLMLWRAGQLVRQAVRGDSSRHPVQRTTGINLEVGVMEFNIPSDTVSEFAQIIEETSGVDINVCYQCKKCTSGCPISYAMDYTPTQLVHAIRLGLKDLVLNSATIWLCASCETCTTRCPQELDLVKVMDTLRIMALRTGVKPKESEVAAFHCTGVANIRFFGRTFELDLIRRLKLSTGQFTKDIGLGIKMLKKGKLNLLPTFRGASTTRRIFAKVKEREKV